MKENSVIAADIVVKRRPRVPPKGKTHVKSTKTKTKYSASKLQPAQQGNGTSDTLSKQNLSSASTILRQLINIPATKTLLDPTLRPNTSMVYTKGVTIWMLILQRLCQGSTIEETVSHVIEHDRHLLPENSRVRDFTLSKNPSGYSSGRKRLSVEDVLTFSQAVCDFLGRTAEPIFDSRRIFILDGTTITLAPTPVLAKAFPPAPNQHGESVWPVAMLMVAAEMRTGCAMLPQVNPMYGPERSSEAKQSAEIVKQLPANSIVMADSGFGIFSVARHSVNAGHDFQFRLTKSRWGALIKRAKLIASADGYQSYKLHWKPSSKDRKSNPDLPADANLEVVLHCIELDNGQSLYLVSSLEIDALSAADLYSCRYDVEFDIRDLKVTMDAEDIRARSVEMVKKELMGSVLAFNLVMQFRRQAARLGGVPPRRLSFKSCWITFKDGILLKDEETFEGWEIRFAAALVTASMRKLPNRSTPRSYPRRAHPRRPKSTKFMKAEATKKATAQPTPPPLVE